MSRKASVLSVTACAIAVGLASLLPLAARADMLELAGTTLEEAELDRTLISKPGWLRGLHFLGQSDPAITKPQIVTVIPPDWAGQVFCARITSMGGDYAALVEFVVPDSLQAAREASLTFAHNSEVPRSVTPEDSGVSLERGQCYDAGTTTQPQPRQFIANYWNELNRPRLVGDMAQLVLHMNVARADELLFDARLGESEPPLPTTCTKLTDPRALAYNYKCVVSVPVNRLQGDVISTLRISYERSYRGRISEPRAADILIGAGQ